MVAVFGYGVDGSGFRGGEGGEWGYIRNGFNARGNVEIIYYIILFFESLYRNYLYMGISLNENKEFTLY